MRRLKLFTDRSYLPEGALPAPILYPFWGGPQSDPRSTTRGRYDRFVEEGPEYLELADLADADVAALPAPWQHVEHDPVARRRAREFAETANAAGRRTLVFYFADSSDPVALPNSVVFRTSLDRSRRAPNEHALPAFSMDVGEHEFTPSQRLREWQPRPVVGFCGYAPGAQRPRSAHDVLRAARRHWRVRRGALPRGIHGRAQALRALARHPDVELNAIVRDAFWAGAVPASGEPDYSRMAIARKEFVDNLAESDYVLCARGGGNFSYRLYETLSAGRIPVFVDTDSVLPFQNEIDWRSLCVWVDEREVHRVGDLVAATHRELGPTGFAERRRACRRTWEDWLSPHGFFRRLGGQPW